MPTNGCGSAATVWDRLLASLLELWEFLPSKMPLAAAATLRNGSIVAAISGSLAAQVPTRTIFMESGDLWKFDVSTKEWTWMSGCNGAVLNNCNNFGVYGTLGSPSAANAPGVRSSAASWTDRNGKLWLFGGSGLPLTNSIGRGTGFIWGALNDLWEFDPSTNQWTWMGGSDKSEQPGVYGTLGTADAANIPSSRSGATIWVDGAGNIWLLAGAPASLLMISGK